MIELPSSCPERGLSWSVLLDPTRAPLASGEDRVKQRKGPLTSSWVNWFLHSANVYGTPHGPGTRVSAKEVPTFGSSA